MQILWREYLFILFVSVFVALAFPLNGNGFPFRHDGLTRFKTRACTRDRQAETTCGAVQSNKAIPISGDLWPDRFPAKEHCSKCGLCETTFVSDVTNSCAFLGEGMARMDAAEILVHGRGRSISDLVWDDTARDSPHQADEARFGVMYENMHLAKGIGINGAQWTGCVTSIALSMLESNQVDAVVCIASKGDWSEPEPILARTSDEVLRGRGVKPCLAPSLKVLDEIKADPSIQRLLFCGVGCAVQAFRSIQPKLALKEVYVLGTNCVDNSPTPQAARNFVQRGLNLDNSAKVQGYEFMQDFKVHVKLGTDKFEKLPYFCLEGSLAQDAIADSCLACFDYTNGLADVVVGYMAAPLESGSSMTTALQSLTIRNPRGAAMVQTSVKAGRLELVRPASGRGKHESISMATVKSDGIVTNIVSNQVRQGRMPRIIGELMAKIMTGIGPKEVAFARYSIDYHLLRNYLHILDFWGEERAKQTMPAYAKEIVEHYLESYPTFQELQDKILDKRR